MSDLSGYIRGYSYDCKGDIHGDDSSVPYPCPRRGMKRVTSDLTLEQVREAGRSAFIGGGERPEWWFVPSDDFVRIRDGKYGKHVAFEDAPSDGWHHISGCDCEFCCS